MTWLGVAQGIIVVTSAGAGALTLLDLALPDRFKTWLKDKAASVYIRFSDERRQFTLRSILTEHPTTFISGAGFWMLLLLLSNSVRDPPSEPLFWIAFGGLVLVHAIEPLFIANPYAKLGTGSRFWPVLSGVLTLILILGPYLALSGQRFTLGWHAFFWIALGFPVGIVAAGFARIVLMSALAMFAVAIYAVEWTALKLAEYDKGPVLFLAALGTAAGALLKPLVE